MIIENDIKLDFDDVLFKPQRSTLSSRKEVDLERTIEFRNSGANFTGIPVIAANMDTVGTFEAGVVLAENHMMTALHKHYTLEDWKENLHIFFENYMAVSIGIKDEDYEKFLKIQSLVNVKYLVIDVANGYSEKFINFVSYIRKENPHLTIIAGNVVSSDITQELILNGADVVKVGIGSGSACTTRLKAATGVPQFSAVVDCFHPSTKVNTDKGLKKISEISIGDMVKTHRGRYRKVLRKIEKKENNKLYSINGSKSTGNHEYYVINKKHKDIVNDDNIHEYAEWVSAQKLTKEYMLIRHNETNK